MLQDLMSMRVFTVLWVAVGCVCAAPALESADAKPRTLESAPKDATQEKDDLTSAASGAYTRGWVGYDYPNSYIGSGITGYGIIDDKYNNHGLGVSGYDGIGYSSGYAGSYGSGYGGGYGNTNYAGYGGYGGQGGYGYGSKGYSGYNGYSGTSGYGGYSGNGGYGGYGGNGGLTSYYGYNNPYYPSGNHLGYGYFNKGKTGYYNGITPSLVTGYRGYSRR